jgi:tRNA-binding protein
MAGVRTRGEPPEKTVSVEEFFRADVRIGTVVEVLPFPEAKKPAWKLHVDFGPGVGVKTSSAQITHHYGPEDLKGRQVMGVVNFPPRQIGPVRSEVLILGFEDENGHVVLAGPERRVPDGTRMT